jgi:hypothetical protein
MMMLVMMGSDGIRDEGRKLDNSWGYYVTLFK